MVQIKLLLSDCCYCSDGGATLKVVGLTSNSKWGGGEGGENTFFSVTLYNFQKRGLPGEAEAPSPFPIRVAP